MTTPAGLDSQTLAFAQAMAPFISTKAVSSTPTTTYGHGPGGLFSSPALERPLISAMSLPVEGLQSILPIRASRFNNPLFGLVTGVTATTGTDPATPCDMPKQAGLMKLCTHSFVFGRQSLATRVFELDRMGLLNDRGEHEDFQFVGGASTNSPNAPTIPGMNGATAALNGEINKALFELAVAWQRDFAREFYTGNPSNNNAGGGREYFRGVDQLVNTGYRDAITGVACPAADSIVRAVNPAFANIESNGASLVRQVTNIYRNLRYIARATGLDPVKFVIAMRWSAFYEATEVWPCAYLTYRCTNLATGTTGFVPMSEQIALRDSMRGDIFTRTGQYLMIDGERVPVVLDDGITEDGIGAGTFRSSIYFIPLTVLGGTPVTYMEYLNYDAPNGAMAAAQALAPQGSYRTSDSGRFLWHMPAPTVYCVQMMAKTETRLVMLAPHLSARLTGIQYTPIQHEREPFSDATYFVNGGQTSYPTLAPSYYSPTA